MAAVEPPSPISVQHIQLNDTGENPVHIANSVQDASPTNFYEDIPAKTNGVEGLPSTTTPEESPEAERTADATVEEPPAETELPKEKHKERVLMERLGVAIDKAIAANSEDITASSVTTNNRNERRYIKARFGDSEPYVVPWTACSTWHAMKALLMEWHREDEDSLRDITNGDITIFHPNKGYIHPQTWEEVIEHDSHIDLRTHSSYYQEPPVQTSTKEYDSSVKYVVNFRRRGADGVESLTTNTYTEPVEYEVTDDNDRLPALEEIKDILSLHYQDAATTDDNTNGKKTTLRPHDHVTDTRLRINSPYLLNILKSVITYTPPPSDEQANDLITGLFYYPYEKLYHHLPALLEYKNGTAALRAKHTPLFNEKYDEHFNVLQKYLGSQPGVPIEEFKQRLERKIPTVTFATYWLLLKPGSEVYVREDDGSLNACIIHSVKGGVSERGEMRTNRSYRILVWDLTFGGDTISPHFRLTNINVFDNEREVTSLAVFPVQFLDANDKGKLEARLVERGERYFTYSKSPAFLQFTGKGLRNGNKTYKRARVVVEHTSAPWVNADFEKAERFYPIKRTELVRGSTRVAQCECRDCRMSFDLQETYDREPFSDYFDIVPSEIEALERPQYKIMASHMYAFVLKDRQYDLVDVDGLEQASMAEDAISSLVMEDNNKEMIKAIARTYTDSDQSSRFSADFIHGKGEGQIILLHGPPGTGKTLTAESVAEYTKRPLLSITAADLGHEPEALETSLLRYFKRANDWDAIVLLDEADVYLEQRTTHDLKRNSIVSVFLRALDYFQGILFLTTNRVGHFDEAFMSRIHLSLGYDPLSDNARNKIWDNLFKKLQQDYKRGGPEITYEYDAKRYVQSREVQALEWNGREIRNAFQTAVALAVFDAKHKTSGKVPEVTEAHLKQVVSMSSAFREYMKGTHGDMDNSSWAYKHGNRDDKYFEHAG